MKLKITYSRFGAKVPRKVAAVYRVAPFGIPSGIVKETLTEAGSMIVASAAGTPAETGAPSADNQAWVSDLTEPLKGRWQAIVTAAGGSIELTNKSGSSQVAGTVVILDKNNDSAFTVSDDANDYRVVGVLEEDTANNATGSVAVAGKIVTTKIQGNVTAGMWLTQSSTEGRAAQYGTIKPSYGAVGIALETYSGGGSSTISVYVNAEIYSANAQIKLLGTAATNGGYGSTLSATHTLSAADNRIAIACVGISSAYTVTGVTYGGVAMTSLGSAASSNQRLYFFYILESSLPANGSKTVTATLSTTAYASISVWTIYNAKQSAPSAIQSSTGTATNLSVSLSVSVAGSLALTAISNTDTGATFTHGSGQTEISDHQTASYGTIATSYKECGSTGTNSLTSTSSGSAASIVMIGTVIEPA